ncbi:hypothetical protein HY464_01390, partial [Candidatus Peregrinibacteria bacterium]|nr:hypothetical protein [Candidatus Peregrinibacteria bacterium]
MPSRAPMTPRGINPRLAKLQSDPLYHLGLNKNMDLVEDPKLQGKDLTKLFGDTKIVCMGGSSDRMTHFAERMATEIPELGVDPKKLHPIGKTERFTLHKVGPILSVSHGMGIGSIRILLHELTKLLYYAGGSTRGILDRVEYIRIGTSGGIGAKIGQVVLSTRAIHPRTLKPVDEIYRMGTTHQFPTEFDSALRERIFAAQGDIEVVVGDTLAANCFYEEEPNLFGALDAGYGKAEQREWAEELKRLGMKNTEMEATALAGFCGRAGIAAADVCAVLDR